jgi:rare lipoprotein A
MGIKQKEANLHLLKSRASKALLLAITSVMFSAMPITASIARENETTTPPKTQITTGVASWYHDKFQGRKTASGDIFSQKKMTCASNKYPLGTWLRITNMKNGKSVLVLVNDRMSPRVKRTVDLSKVAAQKIGIEKAGVGKVTIENLGTKKPAVS